MDDLLKNVDTIPCKGSTNCLDTSKIEDCPHCENVGWYMVLDYEGEPAQELCQWCDLTPNSRFNLTKH